MKTIANCTQQKPMPKDADQETVIWFHHGSRPKLGEPPMVNNGDTQIWICPNCFHEFPVTRTGKISKAAAIRKAKEMRERGFRHS